MSGSSYALKAPGLIRRLGAWPAYAALALFVLLPLAGLVLELIWDDTDIVSRVREDRLVMAALANTLALGAGTASVSLMGARKRQLMIVLLGVPLTFSGLVIAYGFILAFGRAGVITQLLALAGANPAEVGKWIYTTAGLAFAYAYYLVPRVALILVPLFANLDRRPFHAALTLGAPPWRAWLDTDFRELAPSFAAVWCLICAVAMGTYGTALALAGTQINILPLLIFLKISDGGGDFPMAAALSLLLLAACLLVLGLGEALTRGRDKHPVNG